MVLGPSTRGKKGCAVEHQEGKAVRLDLQTWWGGGGGKNWKKAGVTINLSSGMRLPTWTSFVGSRIDVRRGRGVSVKPANKC